MTKAADEIRAEHAHRNATIISDMFAELRGEIMASKKEVSDLKAALNDIGNMAYTAIDDVKDTPKTGAGYHLISALNVIRERIHDETIDDD